jgi:hypothetical protein
VALNPELFQQEQARVRERFENAVEPDRDGCWWADMGPVDGPVLEPFRSRTEALGAERGWLVGQIVETARNQRLPGTAPDTSALLVAFEANRCRSGLEDP